MRAFAASPGNGGTRSWSFASSSAMSGGSRSRRVETTWPNLTKIGPRSSSARRRRSPRVPLPAREPGPGREPEHEAQRAVQVRRAHEVVEPVAHEHAVDGEQPAGDAQRDHAGAPRRARRPPTRASRRSTASRSRSTSVEELLDLEAHRQVAALLGQVLGGVARERVAARAARRRARRARSPRGSARRRRP